MRTAAAALDHRTVQSLAFLSLAGGALAAHRSGQLSPYLPVSFLAATVLTALAVYRVERSSQYYLTLASIVALGTLYRLAVFLFPASLIGIDPSWYATLIRRLQIVGTTDAISNSFYSNAPFFHVYAAEFSFASDLSVSASLGLYPVVVGLTLPLFVTLLVERAVDAAGPNRVALFGGLLASTTTMSVLFSYWPIAQTLAAVYFLASVYLLVKGADSPSDRALLVLLSAGITLTHKLVLLPLFAVAAVLALGYLVDRVESIDAGAVASRWDVTFAALLFVLLLVQWSVLTPYVVSVALKVVTLVTDQSRELLQSSVAPSHAVPPMSSFEALIALRIHALVLLPVSGLAWVYLVSRYPYSRAQATVLAAAMVAVGFVGVSVVDPATITINRTVFLAEPLLVAVVVYAVYARFGDVRRAVGGGAVAFLLVVVVLGSQLLAADAVPDYRDTPRYYLNDGELRGKEFAAEHAVGAVRTDWYYAQEPTPATIRRQPPPTEWGGKGDYGRFRPFDGALENGTLVDEGYETVLYREDVSVYRLGSGVWRLTWNPEPSLDATYSKVYSSGASTLYWRADATNESAPAASVPRRGSTPG